MQFVTISNKNRDSIAKSLSLKPHEKKEYLVLGKIIDLDSLSRRINARRASARDEVNGV